MTELKRIARLLCQDENGRCLHDDDTCEKHLECAFTIKAKRLLEVGVDFKNQTTINSAHKMTNREWLESLSDKDLAQFIRQISTCYAHNFDCETCVLGSVKVCENQQELEQWLKAERSESE